MPGISIRQRVSVDLKAVRPVAGTQLEVFSANCLLNLVTKMMRSVLTLGLITIVTDGGEMDSFKPNFRYFVVCVCVCRECNDDHGDVDQRDAVQ